MGGFNQASSAAIGTIGFIEATVGTVRDDVGNSTTVRPHHGATGSHGFQQHEAKGLRAGGEQEGIATGIGAGELLSCQIAHERGGCAFEMLLQLLAVRTVSHQGESCLRECLEHGANPFDLLFGGQSADIEQQGTAVVVAPQQSLSHGVAAQFRSEQIGVDTPLPKVGVLNSLIAQLLHHGSGRAEVEQGLVVGGFEHFPQQRLQHPQAVMLEVFR